MDEHYPRADDVIITDRLGERHGRAPDHAAESRALEALAEELAERPENLLQKLAETLVELGIADPAGISIEEVAGASSVPLGRSRRRLEPLSAWHHTLRRQPVRRGGRARRDDAVRGPRNGSFPPQKRNR